MIKLKIDNEEYTINKDFSVSNGKYKSFIENCIEMIRFDYRVSCGYFEPYLYIHLGDFKMINLISIDFSPPDDDNLIYWFFMEQQSKLETNK